MTVPFLFDDGTVGAALANAAMVAGSPERGKTDDRCQVPFGRNALQTDGSVSIRGPPIRSMQ